MRQAVDMSDAVLPVTAVRYDDSERIGLYACCSSATSPSHSRPIVAANRAETSVPRDAAISDARASRKSPATMATRLPQRALTLCTPRRLSASSMTSSW